MAWLSVRQVQWDTRLLLTSSSRSRGWLVLPMKGIKLIRMYDCEAVGYSVKLRLHCVTESVVLLADFVMWNYSFVQTCPLRLTLPGHGFHLLAKRVKAWTTAPFLQLSARKNGAFRLSDHEMAAINLRAKQRHHIAISNNWFERVYQYSSLGCQ